jgi:hypothetical protein
MWRNVKFSNMIFGHDITLFIDCIRFARGILSGVWKTNDKSKKRNTSKDRRNETLS